MLDGLKLKIDRAEFDAGLYRLLAKRLDPDPAKRGTAAELKRDFEKFARIRKTPATLDPPGKRRARVALPFTQELVEPAQGEHPLLKAARLCGELERDEEEGPARAASRARAPAGADAPPVRRPA